MNPQKENGYTAIANEIMEALIKYRLPGEQMQCLLFIIRKTYGFNKKTDSISLSQFVKATGINRGNVARAIKALNHKNLIYVEKGSVKKDTILISKYRFNKRYGCWLSSVKKDTGSVNIDKKIVSKKTHTKVDNTKASIEYTPNFLTFWEEYPKKLGKLSSFEAYQAIKKPRPTLQIILDSIVLQKNSDQWQNKQFIPYPATWINERRWEDEIEHTPPFIHAKADLTPEEQIQEFLS